MFQNLVPSTNYTVSVAMRNGIGEGPVAAVFVATPKEPEGTIITILIYFVFIGYILNLQ